MYLLFYYHVLLTTGFTGVYKSHGERWILSLFPHLPVPSHYSLACTHTHMALQNITFLPVFAAQFYASWCGCKIPLLRLPHTAAGRSLKECKRGDTEKTCVSFFFLAWMHVVMIQWKVCFEQSGMNQISSRCCCCFCETLHEQEKVAQVLRSSVVCCSWYINFQFVWVRLCTAGLHQVWLHGCRHFF